ncbi:MFS general substrate transporter [Lophium mytilinum]|uniref:MFS general substrate transporter n=1 Tax=Lophium mytilinum TaxID=390894 RepID=A0A6A6R624_9PEZI|nr:MFS general substrate transporter [Lophium mytilinum]
MATSPTNLSEKHNTQDVKVENVDSLPQDVKADEEDFQFTFGKALATFSFFLGYLADVFSLTLASAILTTINSDIGPSPEYAWIITSRLIVIAVMSPMVGRLSNIFGRRWCFLIGGVLGVVGSAISAAGQDINTLIGGGVILGLSASMHQLAWAALGEIVPKKTRPLAFGFMQTGLAVAAGFSAPISNALVIHTGTWRYAYWLPLIVNGLAFVLVFFFYRPMNQYIREEGKTQWQQCADLDWLGFFLLTAGLTLFLLGITFGGHGFPWVSAGPISMIVIGFLTLVVLGVYEAYHPMLFPIFPPEIFRNVRGFTVVKVG